MAIHITIQEEKSKGLPSKVRMFWNIKVLAGKIAMQ
jgi:hypothetical protein